MNLVQLNGYQPGDESGGSDGLTRIHRRIHCLATNQPGAAENELQEREITHFIDALAEIALAVARRRLDQAQ